MNSIICENVLLNKIITLRFVKECMQNTNKILITSYDMVHWYVRDNGHGLTTHVNFMVKCVCDI
jgi:hypothetical protein